MPPLRAARTAEQAVVTGPAAAPSRRRGSPAWVWLLVGALIAGIGVFAGLTLLGDSGTPAVGPTTPPPSTSPSATPTPSPTPTPTPTSTAPAPPSTVTVVADDYVGRPVEEVQAELAALQLQVAVAPETTEDAPEGTVTAVEPSGELSIGSTVTVSYAVAPTKKSDQNGNGNDNGDGKKKKDRKKKNDD
jgi:serine/threonine-protein kinase